MYSNGYKALTDLNLEITNGIFGLLGPNGAGKSSLMKTIVGLQKPTEGTIHFNGMDVVENPRYIQRHLGFLPQYFGVYPKVSAYDLLQHLAKLKGMGNAKQRHDQILNLLEQVNLAEVRNRAVHTFSGGMKQRFGVAQALLGAPKIILVDEPTAGLDPEERNRFNMLLSAMGEDIIVMLSTHLVEDVRNLCSQMAIMKNGQVVSQGSPRAYLHELSGKLWSKAVTQKELEQVQSNHQIIHSRLVERVMNITVYADDCPAGFTPTDPSLEHAYFAHLNTTEL